MRSFSIVLAMLLCITNVQCGFLENVYNWFGISTPCGSIGGCKVDVRAAEILTQVYDSGDVFRFSSLDNKTLVKYDALFPRSGQFYDTLLHEMVHCWSYYEPALLQVDEGAHHGVSFHLKRIAINCQQTEYHVTLNVGEPIVAGYDAVLTRYSSRCASRKRTKSSKWVTGHSHTFSC